MHIIMLSTRYGSEDGFAVRRFIQNHQYEIADSLGAYFIRIGVAIIENPHPNPLPEGEGMLKKIQKG